MHVACPYTLDETNAVGFVNTLWDAQEETELVTDFSSLGFAYPSGVLISAICIRDVVRRRKALGLETTATGHRRTVGAVSYLNFFGYFQFMGLSTGNPPGAAPGGATYLPIERINLAEVTSAGAKLQEMIDQRSKHLAKVIYPQQEDLSRMDMLRYCFREIIRNSFEHAEVQECLVMAQRWSNGFAEITIADEGIGLAESLSQAHEIKNTRAAIQLAMKPGISRVTEPTSDDKWQNSGYGLYVVSQLGKQLGKFSIVSQDAMLLVNNNGAQWLSTPSKGTVVNLRVNTANAEYFPNILHNIVKEGEKSAKGIAGARVSASKGSNSVDPLFG